MAGLYTPGFPQATSLTGNELIPADLTNSSGVAPETIAIPSSLFRAGPNGTAVATAGAATLNAVKGVVTSEALTTAAGSDYTLTITNSAITASSIVLASAANGTNTTEGLAINRVQPGAGSVVIHVRNTNASSALNGTIAVSFVSF